MQKYRIVMQTPLGERCGTLTADISGGAVNGTLDLFEHKQPFTGTISPDGQCSISGTFVTLLRTVHFAAVGRMTDSSLSLRMQGERNVFLLTGTACDMEEEIPQ